MTLYADCGLSPNDNYLSVAADHVDNGNHSAIGVISRIS